jgi:Thiamine pyrophosphate enzyme, central domain
MGLLIVEVSLPPAPSSGTTISFARNCGSLITSSLTKRGVAVLVVPVDVANAAAHDERPYAVHVRRPLVRPSDADLDETAAILNNSNAITIYAGAGCAGAYDEVVATAARLKAPMAHMSRGKDFAEYDNPYNVGMTGMLGGLARRPCLTAGLLRRKDHLAEDAAASVHVDEVDLLDRFEAQVLAHDLACDQNDRGTVAIGFVEAIDEVETAWSTRACAGGEPAGELSFGARRKSPGLFVPHMDPLDRATVDGMSDLVQRIAHDPVAPLHTSRSQHFDE